MEEMAKLIAVARGRAKADLVLKGARVFQTFTGRFEAGDVAICGGRIAGIGSYDGVVELEARGKFVTPGFIDGHVHIESSMVSPAEFARAVVPAGTTAVVADPHEIANVAGAAGVRYMLEATERLPLDVYLMLPSCVPATHLETAGAALPAEALRPFLAQPRVLGLGEMMNGAGVLAADPAVLAKLALTDLIDGHAPGLEGRDLMAYAAAGVRSDHECVSAAQARRRLAAGIHVMLRQGSATRNLLDLLPAVDGHTARFCMFATDDRHPDDLLTGGHINQMVKMAVDAGLDPALAIQMATYNTASYFRLRDLGAVAPGYRADLLVFDNLTDWRPALVLKNGAPAARLGEMAMEIRAAGGVGNTMRLRRPEAAQLRVPAAASGRARVIGLTPRQIVTEDLTLELPVADGAFQADPERDVLKLAVFERHRRTGHVGVGFVKGLGLRRGALASTVAHDAHNLVVAGASDADILAAAYEVERIGGGIAAAADGRALGSLPLPLGGLMSDRPVREVAEKLARLKKTAYEMGVRQTFEPFMTLAFLSLPVIPALKLTDLGLVDTAAFRVVPVALP